MRRSIALVVASMAMLPLPGQAATSLCSGTWVGTTANRPATETIGGSLPCPVPSLTVTLNNVGSGPNVNGVPFGINYSLQPYASGLTLTSNTAIGIGAGNNKTVTFNRPTANPYLLFSFIDPGVAYTFTQSFELVGINRATRNGQTITGANNAGDLASSGFVVKLLGTYSSASFSAVGSGTPSAGFTVAVPSTPPAAPGPLPILGGAAAWGGSRRLRQRIRDARSSVD